ncbi:ribokinase [Georgenia sp. EYE_87]|uniref:ribokinase n=1 Tax=Georgenia sp. EYE_87 TaxID=2853448 RepID=UPI0020064C3C|nr:ribokinase [Georgenia sp. EYE_87]MCK6209505.1 ribokinase [Georgenia sp. EYE_87]
MKIAVVGGYGVGMTMRVPHFPTPGETVSGGAYAEGPGGKGSNQAIAAARLGADVSLLTAIGKDHLADAAGRLWDREKVQHDHVVRTDSTTMVGFILVGDDGENEIAIAPGALSDLTADHVENFRETIRDADIVMVSMEIPLEAVGAALRIAKEEGTTSLLNPAPAVRLPDDLWDWIDILTPNQSEAAQILNLPVTHDRSAADVAEQLRARTDAAIVMTLGSSGCAVLDGTEFRQVGAFAPSEVLDTTGAGDTFNAALAVAIARGESLERAARFANAAGAHAVTRSGVIDALPTPEQIARVMGT